MSGQTREKGRMAVGVDGLASAKAAVRWAERQAELTDSTVRAVSAWEYPPLYGSIGGLDAPQELADHMKGAASQALDQPAGEVVRPEQAVRAYPALAYGTPVAVLLDQARAPTSGGRQSRTRRVVGAVAGVGWSALHPACAVPGGCFGRAK
ncbi:universal stress protein [Streptomyces sp. YGL11-2]|uniref:universal stress protein n=1 Tax=Streptomyces sp. YGL11-2 TaxID=3414028 RepID=UPI003CE77F35